MSQKPFLLFFKSHVDTFTRKDGAVVQAHETKVQAKASESPPKQFAVGDGRNIKNAVFDHDKKLMRGFDSKDHAKEFADGLNHVHAAGKADQMKQSVSAAADKHLGSISGADIHAHGASDSFGQLGRVGFGHAMTAAYKAGNGGKVDDISAHNHALDISKKHGMFDSFKAKNSDSEDFKETNHESVRHALQHAYALGSTHASAQKDHDAGVFKKPKSHEKLHKEAEAGVAHSPEHAAEHKRLMGLYGGSSADWERQAVNRSINKNHQRALKEAPAKTAPAEVAPVKVATKNEGYGYHGAAMDAHRAEKFGVDGDLKTEADHVEQRKVADQAFSRVADKLVKDGHFSSHEEAGNYLDSRDGRHVGDEIGHKGDPSSVSWLARSVARHKKELAKNKG